MEMQEIFYTAKKAGAESCLIAFSSGDKHIENNIAVEMVQAFKKNEVQANALILDLDTRGAFILS